MREEEVEGEGMRGSDRKMNREKINNDHSPISLRSWGTFTLYMKSLILRSKSSKRSKSSPVEPATLLPSVEYIATLCVGERVAAVFCHLLDKPMPCSQYRSRNLFPSE